MAAAGAQNEIEAALIDVAQAALDLHARCKDEPCVVAPSLPILFFGDSRRYGRSAIRIVTVGLNPSRHEFPARDPWTRFGRDAEGLDAEGYIDTLDRYFGVNPYRRWFRSFEPILNGMNASYYGESTNVALNTDICSPLATDPTWSGLDAKTRSELMRDGVPLWHRLIEALKPDVIVVSVAREHLRLIQWGQIAPWQPLIGFGDRKNGTARRTPYVVQHATFAIADRPATIVSGPAARTPFGFLTDDQKRAIGGAIVQHVTARGSPTMSIDARPPLVAQYTGV